MTVTTTEDNAATPSPTDQAQDPAPAGSIIAEADSRVAHVEDDALVEEDLLVEDISIDGMCGVY